MTDAPLFDALQRRPPDPLLALIGAFSLDERPEKIDVGVGVYRDETGATPVFRAVSEAERRLVRKQSTKSYLGPEGNIPFLEALVPIVFGDVRPGARMSAVQTPGGTGALRLAAELIAAARPGARVHVGEPTWPNHAPILNSAALELVRHSYYDVKTQRICFDAMSASLGSARRGDIVLLHASCHNPTGADLDLEQWATVAALLASRGLVPMIDMAYQGLGASLDADARGARIVVEAADEAIVAYSCDKNFGLYRERVGALFVRSATAAQAEVVQSNLLSLSRANWSMPPDHGAAVVAEILEDPELERDWRVELDGMSARIRSVRRLLAAADTRLSYLVEQRGLFGMIPLTPTQVETLRERRGVYMPSSGRINIAGLTPAIVRPFVDALASVW